MRILNQKLILKNGGRNIHWPNNDMLLAVDMSLKYAILHRIAMMNWISSIHTNPLLRDLCAFIYMIRMRKTFDLGSIISNHIMSFVKPREQNVKMPFPNLIYGILSAQGLELYDYEVNMRALESYSVDHKLFKVNM